MDINNIIQKLNNFGYRAVLEASSLHVTSLNEDAVINFANNTVEFCNDLFGLDLGESKHIAMPFNEFKRIDCEFTKNVMSVVSFDNDLTNNLNISNKLASEIYDIVNKLNDKDSYTADHSIRVAQYAKQTAEKLGYSPEQVNKITLAGLCHDLGKLKIPDEIVKGEKGLTDEEFLIMKTHAALGLKTALEDYPEISKYPEILDSFNHHPKYPVTEPGETAKLLACADVLDALTSERSYKKPFSKEDTVRIMTNANELDNNYKNIVLGMYINNEYDMSLNYNNFHKLGLQNINIDEISSKNNTIATNIKEDKDVLKAEINNFISQAMGSYNTVKDAILTENIESKLYTPSTPRIKPVQRTMQTINFNEKKEEILKRGSLGINVNNPKADWKNLAHGLKTNDTQKQMLR